MAARDALVVAVDDSDAADLAFAWAAKYCERLGAELHLVHAVHRQLACPDHEYDKVLNAAEALVNRRFVAKLPENFEPRPVIHIIKTELDKDSVGHVLVKKAQQLNAIALVMSSHDKGRVAEFFVGSVTKYALSHAKTPVVVVPKPQA